MNDNDKPDADAVARKPRIQGSAALPAQLGRKLRQIFAEAEAQPPPDRLQELMNALAAKERKSD